MGSILDDLPDIHHWSRYNPLEPQYVKFEPEIIATAHKIVDVYSAFCSARWNLAFYEINDYGEMIQSNDEISKKYLKSNLVLNSLIFYNICIDLSWQSVWFNYYKSSFELIYDNLYVKASKGCVYDTLLELLSYRSSYPSADAEVAKLLKSHVVSFFESEIVNRVREQYNYLKHRGSFHIPGLGMNDSKVAFSVDGFSPQMLTRREMDVESTVQDLLTYDRAFAAYFEKIIELLIPEDFTVGKFNLSDPIHHYNEVKEYLDKRE